MSQLDRRQALKLFAGLGAAAAVPSLAACGGSSLSEDSGSGSSGGPIKIGMLAPQSGVYKVIGDDMINGFKLYLQLHGNKLGGREVDLIIADEGETGDSGRAGAEKLLKQDKVLAMTGVVSSAVMGAIVDMVETAQVPLVGSNASPTTLQGVTYIWRTSYVNDEPGKALGEYLGRTLKGTVYCIAADYQAGKDEVNGLLSTLPKDKLYGDPVYTPFAPNPTTNFQPYLTAIKQSDAEAVFCFYAGSSAVEFVKQYKQFGVNKRLYAPGFLTEGKVIESQGDAALGIFTSMNYAADLDNPANRTFASEYQKQPGWGIPTTYAMASYDAAAVLDKAITIAGDDLTPQSLNAAIGKIGQIDSPRGAWQFNQNRTPLQKWYLREVRRDGGVLSNVLVSELTTLG
ncbi:MAG: ABC transporter substrate-binding protein [Dactylosporangium sp.]|nr:ABC transporter substrate-binding protein [Dactylosporangium sp.]